MLTIWPTDMGGRGSTAFGLKLEKVWVNVLTGFTRLHWQTAGLGSADWSKVGFFTKVFQSKRVCTRLWHKYSHTLTQREGLEWSVYVFVCIVCMLRLENEEVVYRERIRKLKALEQWQRWCCFCFWKANEALHIHRSIVL